MHDRSSVIAALLTSDDAPRLILLNAPAGFGKSLAVTQWLRNHHDGSRPVEWLHTGRLTSLDDAAVVVESRAGPLTLIIDDYHLLTDAENDLALADLVARNPELLLVVISRRVRLLDGPLVAGRTSVAIVDKRQLALASDEVESMLSESGAADTEQMRTALERCGGWPVAVIGVLSEAGRQQPLETLDLIAMSHRGLLSENDRSVLMAASLIDAITPELAADATGLSLSEVRACVLHLLEMGAVVAQHSGDRAEYRCHSAVRAVTARRAQHVFDPDSIARLRSARASELTDSDPLAAFTYYCSVEAYGEAEIVIARHFGLATHTPEASLPILRAVPERVLVEHPVFISARLILEFADPLVPTSVIQRLSMLVQQGTLERLSTAERPEDLGELLLPALTQKMFAARHNAEFELAREMLDEIEFALTNPASLTTPLPGLSSLSMYYREIALTAIALGDLERSRLNWERLRLQSEAIISAPRHTENERMLKGARLTLLVALNGLAIVELLDGRLHLSASMLAEADTMRAAAGLEAPGATWVVGEIARAHIASELGDEKMLRRALDRLVPLRERIEPWEMLLIAETEWVRRHRGVSWAVTDLLSSMRRLKGHPRVDTVWGRRFALYRAMLHTVLGNFTTAAAVIGTVQEADTDLEIERARLALYEGEDVKALLIAQEAGQNDLNRREQTARGLIAAAAAWACGRSDEALDAFEEACEMLVENSLHSELWSVPWKPLHEIALASAAAGAPRSYVELLEQVPPPVRSRRYERLTETELGTLAAISQHHSINDTALAMHVTPATVKKHLSAVYRKLQVSGRDAAIVQATRMGLLQG